MAYPMTRTDFRSWALIPSGSPAQDFLHEVSLTKDFAEYAEIAANALFNEATVMEKRKMFNIPEALEPRPTDYSVHFRKGGRIGQAVHVTSYTAIGAAQLAMRERQDLIQDGYRVAWVDHYDEKAKRRVID